MPLTRARRVAAVELTKWSPSRVATSGRSGSWSAQRHRAASRWGSTGPRRGGPVRGVEVMGTRGRGHLATYPRVADLVDLSG